MNQTQTIERALDILFVLAEAETTLSVSEIAERVPLPDSTAYRLIKTLEVNGVVERKGKGKISLGMRLLDLARSLHTQIDRDLLTIARPVMEKITQSLNETSLLVVRRGEIGVSMQHVEGSHLIGFVSENGKTHPLHEGASGKSILAFETAQFIEKVLSTIDGVDKEKVYKELAAIKKNGYVKTIGEVDPDTLAVAAPIMDEYNRVIASLSIIGPRERFDEETLRRSIKEVLEATKEISRNISEYSITMLP